MQTVNGNAYIRRDSACFRFLCLLGFLDIVTWAVCITAIVLSRRERDVYEAKLRAYYAQVGPGSTCTNAPNTCPPYEPRLDFHYVLIFTLVPLVYDTMFLPPALLFAAQNSLHTVILLSGAVAAFMVWAAFGVIKVIESVWWAIEVQPDTLDHIWAAIAGLQLIIAAIWLGILVAAGRRLARHNKEKWRNGGTGMAQLGALRGM